MKKLLKFNLRHMTRVLYPALSILLATTLMLCGALILGGEPVKEFMTSDPSGGSFAISNAAQLTLSLGILIWIFEVLFIPFLILISGIESFRKELTEDFGKLYFMIPVTGASILLSKLLATTLSVCAAYYSSLGAVCLVFSTPGLAKGTTLVSELLQKPRLYLDIALIGTAIITFIAVWIGIAAIFSIVLSKAFLGGHKARWMVTVSAFLGICALDYTLSQWTERLLPYQINLFPWIGAATRDLFGPDLNCNVGVILCEAILLAILFWTSQHLLDKRVDIS